MSVFDLSKPGVRVIPIFDLSKPGCVRVIPITDRGEDVLERFFEAPPYSIAPLDGEIGYIVEPHESAPLAEYLHDAGVAWVIDNAL